jgi:hypothetical protein
LELQTLFGRESAARKPFLKKQAMQHISTLCIKNGVPFVPDSKPVALKLGKSTDFHGRFKNGFRFSYNFNLFQRTAMVPPCFWAPLESIS